MNTLLELLAHLIGKSVAFFLGTKRMIQNLFLVSTPLQLINAIEARDRFHFGEKNGLAIVRTPLRSGVDSDRFHRMLQRFVDDHWSDVWFLKMNKLRQFLFALLSQRYIARHSTLERIYTGSFQSPQCHLINSIRHRHLTVLDDGCGIHQLLAEYPDRNRKEKWRHRILLKRSTWPSRTDLQVFTCFNVNWNKELVVHNDYRSFRENVVNQFPIADDEIVFASQPMEDTFGISVNHDRIIKTLHQVAGTNRIRWINHPKERNPPHFGESLDYPLEFFGIEEGYLPSAFATFNSSAIRTLQLLYQRPSFALELTASAMSKPAPVHLGMIYDDFRSSGIQTIPESGWSTTDQASVSSLKQAS